MAQSDTIHPLDAAARQAFSAFCSQTQRHELPEIPPLNTISYRLVQRLFARKAPVPPGLAREIAVKMDWKPKAAAALIAWADHCDQLRSKAHD
jgi:hypothetical protein